MTPAQFEQGQYTPSARTLGILSALNGRNWNPPHIDCLLSIRDQLDVEHYALVTKHNLAGAAQTTACMIQEIDMTLTSYYDMDTARPLVLEQGSWIPSENPDQYPDETNDVWLCKSRMELPNTPESIRAAALIMGVAEEEVRYGLEDEGSCSTSTHQLIYLPVEDEASAAESQ